MCRQPIEKLILKSIRSSRRRLTRPDLQRHLMARHRVRAHDVKAAINSLLQQNEIAYSSHFGSSFLEISYGKPVRVTASIVIKPPSCDFVPGSGDIVIDLNPGVSFGDGRHPTTQLSLKGLDFLFKRKKITKNQKEPRVLDIGTGSGILVIAAIKLGFACGLGLDVDPCALAEARENILQNGLERRICISDVPVDAIDSKFLLIIANLRLPTLEHLFSHLLERAEENGYILLSGVKTEELALFQREKQEEGRVDAVWQAHALGWSAAAFEKKKSASE